jgi:hypothetical protein
MVEINPLDQVGRSVQTFSKGRFKLDMPGLFSQRPFPRCLRKVEEPVGVDPHDRGGDQTPVPPIRTRWSPMEIEVSRFGEAVALSV